MTVDELIERSHATSVSHGWWPDGVPGTRTVADQVNNYAAELLEAWEEYRAGRMDLWLDNTSQSTKSPKPEGFYVEIADLLIRLGDTIGAYKWTESRIAMERATEGMSIPLFVKWLRKHINQLDSACHDNWIDCSDILLHDIIHECIAYAADHGVNLLDLCELKMKYNETRPYRHGNKLA